MCENAVLCKRDITFRSEGNMCKCVTSKEFEVTTRIGILFMLCEVKKGIGLCARKCSDYICNPIEPSSTPRKNHVTSGIAVEAKITC
jgi:hypothetical protein